MNARHIHISLLLYLRYPPQGVVAFLFFRFCLLIITFTAPREIPQKGWEFSLACRLYRRKKERKKEKILEIM